MEEYRNKQKARRPLVFLQQKFKKETGEILPRWVIKNLIKKYGFDRVIGQLKETNFSNTKNPIGYLTEAIKNNWKIWREPEYLKRYRVKKEADVKESKKLRIRRGVKDSYLQELEYENQKRQRIERQKELLCRK